MTNGEKLYAAHVASAKNPKTWKPWANLTSAIKAVWEGKADKKAAHNPKPKSKPAKKTAAKKAKGGKK